MFFERCESCDTPRWRHWRGHDFESHLDDAYDLGVSWDELEINEHGEWVRIEIESGEQLTAVETEIESPT